MLCKQTVLVYAFLALYPSGYIQRVLLDEFLFHELCATALMQPPPCVFVYLRCEVLVAVLGYLFEVFRDRRHILTDQSIVLLRELYLGEWCLAWVTVHQLFR